jgi:hypothetical protein
LKSLGLSGTVSFIFSIFPKDLTCTKSNANLFLKDSAIFLALLKATCFAQSGSIFKDYNGDGIKQSSEPNVEGIIVKAYNSSLYQHNN